MNSNVSRAQHKAEEEIRNLETRDQGNLSDRKWRDSRTSGCVCPHHKGPTMKLAVPAIPDGFHRKSFQEGLLP